MDYVDLIIVVLVVVAAINGLRVGGAAQLLTYGGFWTGLTLGALLTAVVVPQLHNSTLKVFVSLVIVLGLALFFGVAGRFCGHWATVALRRRKMGRIDQTVGVGLAVIAVLVSSWLVASVLSQSRYTWVTSGIEKSDILRTVDDILPPVPSVISRVETFLGNEGFPPVFVTLAPPPAIPVQIPTDAQAQAIAAGAVGSTVKVLGVACGDLQEGSGFVVGRGLVVTNAHVVAGEPSTQIVVGGTQFRATPILFDPGLDLAVLRTDAPLGAALPLDPVTVARGTQAAVLGYPEDGPLTIAPAGVTATFEAEGRDIYNEGLVIRQVYEIDAQIRPGNSGGPLFDRQGQVIGVVFSRSTVNNNVGFALSSPKVLSEVQDASRNDVAVSTGGCVGD